MSKIKKLLTCFFLFNFIDANLTIDPYQLLGNALLLAEKSEQLISEYIETGKCLDTHENRRAALVGFFIYLGKCSQENNERKKLNHDKIMMLFDIIDMYFDRNPQLVTTELYQFLFPVLQNWNKEIRPSVIETLNTIDPLLNKKSELVISYSNLFIEHENKSPYELLVLLTGSPTEASSFLKNKTNRWLIEMGYCIQAGALIENLSKENLGEAIILNDMLSLYEKNENDDLLDAFFL